jgi:hypothetical protein
MDAAGLTGASAMNDDLQTDRRQDAHSQRAALIGLAICLALVLGVDTDH